jgi:hypothetical protein
MKALCIVLLVAAVSCSGRRMAPQAGPQATGDISASERAAILRHLAKAGETEDIGAIRRVSVDTFHVDVGGVDYVLSLRADRILTYGDPTAREIELIKEEANRRRRMKQFDITSIKKTGADTVEAMTGDFGTATGEVIAFERREGDWKVKSVTTWVE